MGSVFLRGDSWVGEYKDRGRIKRLTFGKKGVVTKTMAKEMLRKVEQKVKLGQYDMLDATIPTLGEFSRDYIEYQRDVRQKRSWKKDTEHLKKWNAVFGSRRLSEIFAKDIDDYKQKRLTQVKGSTVNRELEVLRRLFYLAKRWKRFFGENPVSESGLLQVNNQIERILTLEEQERLLSCSAPHLKPIIITALTTGMRKGEILSLTWEDVNFNNNLITIRHTISKSKKTRLVPINLTLRKALLEQKLKTGQSGYVFLTPEGKPYSPNNANALKRAFGMACKRANIQGLRFHDLRHTAATRMIEEGVGIEKVSKILGHATIDMTMRYAHPDDSLKEAAETLSRYFSDSITDKSTDTQKQKPLA